MTAVAVNTDLLKQHAAAYKMSKDAAVEYHKQLFSLHPEFAKYYDAEDIDPDFLARSHKFTIQGQTELGYFFRLPQAFGGDERAWRTALSGFKEVFAENNALPMGNFSKVVDPFLAAMEKHAGGLSAEQKKNWQALFTQAEVDMKKWGWL